MSCPQLHALERRAWHRAQAASPRLFALTPEARAGAVYAIAEGCVPPEDAALARLFADNLLVLDTTDFDAREAMEEDDGIHLCRGIRYALTMHLFYTAEAAVRDATARAQRVQAATSVPNGAAGTPIYWSPDPASRETIADKGLTYPLDGNLLVMFAMHRTMQSMNGLVLYLPAQG